MRVLKLGFFLLFMCVCFIGVAQNESGDTTITFSELTLLKEDSKLLSICEEILQDQKLQIYNFKRVLRENNNIIMSLKYRNIKLINSINEHNESLKKSQGKYKIKIN